MAGFEFLALVLGGKFVRSTLAAVTLGFLKLQKEGNRKKKLLSEHNHDHTTEILAHLAKAVALLVVIISLGFC